jgi:hypothetical protein
MKFFKWLKEAFTEDAGIVALALFLAAACTIVFNVLLLVK